MDLQGQAIFVVVLVDESRTANILIIMYMLMKVKKSRTSRRLTTEHDIMSFM